MRDARIVRSHHKMANSNFNMDGVVNWERISNPRYASHSNLGIGRLTSHSFDSNFSPHYLIRTWPGPALFAANSRCTDVAASPLPAHSSRH